MNRPSTLNRLDEAMSEQLLAALDAAAADSAVRCLVLTGRGRVYSAGQELSIPIGSPQETFETLSIENNIEDTIERYQIPIVERLRSMPMPLVAAVSGRAAGAGVSLALNCDVVIATKSATFVQHSVEVGLLPDAGNSWLLPRLVGRARALGWTLLGDVLKAEDAVRMGLIWDCFPDHAFGSVVRSVAQRLAAMPIRAAVAARKALDTASTLSLRDALLAEACVQRELGSAHDYRESIAAHRAHRPAAYTDR